MVKLYFEKIYNTDRIAEPCFIGFPVKKGELKSLNDVSVLDEEGKEVPSQNKVTAYWDDGSVKWLYTGFFADIYGDKDATYGCELHSSHKKTFPKMSFKDNVLQDSGFKAKLAVNSEYLFECIEYSDIRYEKFISLPSFEAEGKKYVLNIDRWEVRECGEVYTVIKGLGTYGDVYGGELTLRFYKDKPWFETEVRFINTTYDKLEMRNWKIDCPVDFEGKRTTVARSNYKTKYQTSEEGEEKYEEITAELLMGEANEHNPEVFYGTFFADVSDYNRGVAATVYQAQQNFPKAVKSCKDGLTVYIIPEDKTVRFEHSMAITQKVMFHLHGGESLFEINNRSIIYQMPDRPAVSPDVFKEADVYPHIFTEKKVNDIEIFLINKADEHSRCYGMLCWGDSPDFGYTNQGRGGGELVWTNNEYDFPHSCAMMYARTGIRRYLDYVLVAGKHWQDVDICHFSDDPLEMNGQYEHTNRHNHGEVIACSHQWVEGLFDYYHFTGDKDAYDAAVKIAENVTRLLDTPQFKFKGETTARETGWALRTLTATYLETNDEKWLEKCSFIVDHFEQWEKEKGHWLSSYMDNVSIRVVFMISVAIVSLMKYNRVRPQKRIEDMIMRAVDDMLENCLLDNGLFYYKEIPSLKRLGNNPIILEALSIAYELSGDVKYLKAGVPTLKYIMSISAASGHMGGKKLIEGVVMNGTVGTKGFAQMMAPITCFYTYASETGIL